MFPILYFADIPDHALDMFDQCCCRFPKLLPIYNAIQLLVLSHNLLISNESFATGSRSILETVIQAIWQSVHRPRFRHLQCSKSLLFLLQRCQCISIFRIDQICWQQSSLICSHFIRQMKIFLWEEVNILMRRSKYSYEKK